MDGNFAGGANPPEVAEEEQRSDPEIFEGEEAQRFGERKAAEIDLQRRVSNVLEGKPRRENLDRAGEEIQRNEQAAEQFDEPELRANQGEDAVAIAQGVVEAAKQVKLNVPLVVRMEGTDVVEGKRILAESGMKVITANGMADAAERIVKEIGA